MNLNQNVNNNFINNFNNNYKNNSGNYQFQLDQIKNLSDNPFNPRTKYNGHLKNNNYQPNYEEDIKKKETRKGIRKSNKRLFKIYMFIKS